MRKLSPNDRIVLSCVGVLIAMIGLTYASVPLYRIYCQLTGFDGTPRIATNNSTTISDRTIEVRFDSNGNMLFVEMQNQLVRKVDAKTGTIVASTLTSKEVDDAAELGPLLDQIDDPLAAVIADGAYDQDRVYDAVAEHSAEAAVVVPPRATAVLSPSAETDPT